MWQEWKFSRYDALLCIAFLSTSRSDSADFSFGFVLYLRLTFCAFVIGYFLYLVCFLSHFRGYRQYILTLFSCIPWYYNTSLQQSQHCYYLRKRGYDFATVVLVVCLLVCVSNITQNLLTHFDEIFKIARQWYKEQLIEFCEISDQNFDPGFILKDSLSA